MPTLQFEDWGRIAYEEGWNKQKQYLDEVLAARDVGKELNYLVFCEHPHVYTLGRHGDEQNLLLNHLQLVASDATFHKVDRGGDITYHGPGQVVGYPIFDLYNWNIGIKEYVRRLEQCLIDTIALYGLRGERMDGATGVWLDVGTTRARKICAIGVKVSRHVTMHGFAFNVNSDLRYFNFINPCGFIDKGVTSLSAELKRDIDMAELKERLLRSMCSVFDGQLV